MLLVRTEIKSDKLMCFGEIFHLGFKTSLPAYNFN